MTILQNFRPMTRAAMAQLSLPDIRAYAKAYKVPADVIEHGTVDELLDLIFKLRPRHPKKYPVDTPHLFVHKIARTQEDRDEEFRGHKPYTGFAYRQNLVSFRRAKSRIGRPFPPEEKHSDRAEEAVEEQHQFTNADDEEPEHLPAHHVDQLVTNPPVAASTVTPTYEQPDPPAEYPQEKLSPFSNPSHPTLPETTNQDLSPAPVAPLSSNNSPAPSQPGRTVAGTSTPKEQGPGDGGNVKPKMTLEQWREFVKKASRGTHPPPVPPALGFEVADDLSNLKSALEEHQEAMVAQSKPSRIIVDDELFDLEFTPDMTQAGKEAVIRERYAIAMSNHGMIEQMLDEAEAEAKQALWQLTTLQPQLNAAHGSMQKFVDDFYTLTGRHKMLRQVVSVGERMAKDAWEADWNEEWISTEEDEREEEMMKEIAQARAAGVQLPPSPSAPIPQSPSRKRTRDEDEDELEYADEGELRAGTLEPDPKRPRFESRGTSTAPPSPSPRGSDKGKGRVLVAEDSYMLPFPSSSFTIPPPPMPRFGPKDRCNIYPIYKPAVPGYEPPQPPEAEDRSQPGQHDGSHSPPSDDDDDLNGGPESDQGQGDGDGDGEEQIGEDNGEYGADNTEERNHSATQMPRGAPPPAGAQPEGPRPGDPWQVLRYDRAVWGGHVVTDHTQMPSDLKRPVNWSMMGSQHPKGASFRDWDDELEEQNPWHQGGRPVLK